MTRVTLPLWYDLHAHFRQDTLLPPLLAQHRAMGCAGALAMPNTKPPVACVMAAEETAEAWSIERYLGLLRQNWPEAHDLIVPLYLTPATTPVMIERGAAAGLLRACKYYPPHGTTNSEHGAAFESYVRNGVFAAMADHGVVLCIHGESHGLHGEDYFGRLGNAEELFYREEMPRLVEKFPGLKIVCEHITTAVAVDFVHAAGPHVAATVTPQHLLYTVGDLLQGCKYHLFCLPVVKFAADVAVLRRAVTAASNGKFFAGTDSAPHTVKATPCGCAGGCYTGGIAPQLYAMAFEQAGASLDSAAGQEAFRRFLCQNGTAFYGLELPKENFVLAREPQEIGIITTPQGPVTPLPLGMLAQPAAQATLPWRVIPTAR